MDMCNSSEIITKKSLFTECIKKNFSISANDNDSRDCELLEIQFKDNKIRTKCPDNVVSLEDGKLLEVTKLFRKNEKLQMNGYILNWTNAFSYPCDSSIIGVYMLTERSKNLSCFSCKSISKKCIKLEIGSRFYIMELLHM